MVQEKVNSLDDYERFLRATIKKWSANQHIALAAAMCERWLPIYDSFSAKEEFGDPSILRQSLQAVWDHVLGRTLNSKDRRRHSARVDENTPHLDDFECHEAIATCAIIEYALKCCDTRDTVTETIMAMVSGFEAVAPGIYTDPDEMPPDIWKSAPVQKELAKQFKVIEQIDGLTRFDENAIEVLRERLTVPDLLGEVPPRPEPVIVGLTNEVMFDRYRAIIELDLKGRQTNEADLGGNVGAIIMTRFSSWCGRYLRRKQMIDETYGPMVDTVAKRALFTRQRAVDATDTGDANWDEETRFWIDLAYQNPLNGFDVSSPAEPHRYGPSLRRLWVEAKRRGESDDEAWRSIVSWGRHRPPAWESEDRRKKAALTSASPALGQHIAREVSWRDAEDPTRPWATEVDGEQWQVRVNDFPDELMYSLVIGGAVVGDFHDWPQTWYRE